MPEVSRLTVAAAALSLVSAPLASRTGAIAVSDEGAPGVAPGPRARRGAWPSDHGRVRRDGLALRIRGRFGLGINDRPGHLRRLLWRHQNVVLLVAIPRFGVGKRVRPALPLTPAGAARIVRFLEFTGVGQIRVRLARRRGRFLDRAAERERIEGHVGVGAQGPADVLQAVRPASGARIGNGEEAAVAGPHAYRIRAGVRLDGSFLARGGRLAAADRRGLRIERPTGHRTAPRAWPGRRTEPRRHCWALRVAHGRIGRCSGRSGRRPRRPRAPAGRQDWPASARFGH